MSKRCFTVLLLVLTGLACNSAPAPESELGPDERALVDLYVRLTLLEALRAEKPDSVDVSLDSMHAHFDSATVHRQFEELAKDPLRWERVFRAITSTLSELEKDPEQWWNKATAESILVLPNESEPAPNR